MIYQEPFPLRNMSLLFLLICFGLISAYIMFIGIISIWVGLNHLQQDGFLVPILAGLFSITAVLWLLIRFSRFIIHRMREREV